MIGELALVRFWLGAFSQVSLTTYKIVFILRPQLLALLFPRQAFPSLLLQRNGNLEHANQCFSWPAHLYFITIKKGQNRDEIFRFICSTCVVPKLVSIEDWFIGEFFIQVVDYPVGINTILKFRPAVNLKQRRTLAAPIKCYFHGMKGPIEVADATLVSSEKAEEIDYTVPAILFLLMINFNFYKIILCSKFIDRL
jgi:hypothetical protein